MAPSSHRPITGGALPAEGVAVVTGGASGLGRAVGALLAGRGLRVVLLDVDTERGEAAARAMGARFIACDVRHRDQWGRARAIIAAEHGPPGLLSFNAGLMTRPSEARLDDDPFAWIAKGGYARVFGVNVDGVSFGLEAMLPIMADGGAIVVTASIAGLVPTAFDPFYAASKHAAIGLVRSVAPLLKPRRIRINAFCPGPIATSLMPAEFVAQTRDAMTAEDAAETVAGLLALDSTGGAWVRQRREDVAARFEFARLGG